MTAKPKSKIYEIAAKQSKLIDELIGLLKDAHEKIELLGTQLREQSGKPKHCFRNLS